MTKRKQTDDIYRQSRELIWHESVVNNNGKRFVLLPYYQLVKPWLNASGALHFSTERSRLIIENFRRGDRHSRQIRNSEKNITAYPTQISWTNQIAVNLFIYFAADPL